MEAIVPVDALGDDEQSDVAFHVFPDSMSLELHAPASVRDSSFFFRIKRDRVLYGFVFCRQRQDERLARGGDQRAVVVVSEAPFSGILRPLSQLLGVAYFNEGPAVLGDVYREVIQWPDPRGLAAVQVMVGARTISATLPPFIVFPPPAPEKAAALDRRSSRMSSLGRRSAGGLQEKNRTASGVGEIETNWTMFQEVDTFVPFKGVVSKLWALWELTLTGQPLVVVAPTPGECSSAVAALISLISPIPYAEDFRPYYSIHDPTFQNLIEACDEAKKQDSPLDLEDNLPHLLGVTNLYFIKALPLWPNVVSIGERPTPVSSSGRQPHLAGPTYGSQQGEPSRLQRFNPRYAYQAMRQRMLKAQVLLSHHIENLWCEDSPLVKPDSDLCTRLASPKASTTTGQPSRMELLRADSVRRHFWSLTTAFLEPFQQYFAIDRDSRKPEGVDESEVAGCGALPKYDALDFLNSLDTHDFPPMLKGRFACHEDCVELYRLFIGSRNFEVWFSRQRQAASSDLGIPYSEEFVPKPGAAHSADASANDVIENGTSFSSYHDAESLGGWKCEDEVLLVEQFFKLEEVLLSSDEAGMNGFIDSETKKQIAAVFQSMSPDLMQALLSSPARAGLVKKLKGIPEINRQLRDIQLN